MGLRPSKKKRREEAIRRQERQDLCREGGLEPQLRPNLTKAQLLQVEELHHEFQLRKRVREEAKDALEAAKKAFEKAEEEWKAADDAVKASSLERRQYYPTKKQKREEDIRRDEHQKLTHLVDAVRANLAELPESIQRGLGVPKLQSNLTPTQKLHFTKLDGEWATAKLE
ncbi:hypothetical protein CNMCM8694_004977 [Aspergillus lentulus]|nr:hypothetical protein CNMCM8060_003379 [Aspergillus lentulus]KAF4188872.1 hypothetical protein CNMCM7927_000446 [Aspergillus lentulus]KAF4196425.1 hypothetical protein CNMCM8694_004977 [Aspergillus lentulus]